MEIGLHYYQFHINDYRGATSHLSNEEDLAYRRLIEMYYDTEAPIPLDLAFVSRRIRIDQQTIQVVLQDFFEETESGWVNNRAEREIKHYHAFIDKQVLNGKRGGRPKKTQAFPTANPSQTQEKPKKSLTTNQQPITNNQIKEQTRTGALLCPPEVSSQVWDDFTAVRRAKRSPVTETALRGIEKEAQKAGWTLEQALAECAARGWSGFKAEWVRGTMREVIDNSRLQMIENTNRVIREMQNAQSKPNVANNGKAPFALRGVVDAEMGGLGPIDVDV
jgi:uncharacterized protein YdaU (DUF1376 family)